MYFIMDKLAGRAGARVRGAVGSAGVVFLTMKYTVPPRAKSQWIFIYPIWFRHEGKNSPPYPRCQLMGYLVGWVVK